MKKPLELTKEDIKLYFGKKVRVKLLEPIILNNPDLIYEELVGHINQISLAANTPNLPMYIEFKHDSVYNRQIGQLKTKLPIKINIYKIKSIEIIPD